MKKKLLVTITAAVIVGAFGIAAAEAPNTMSTKKDQANVVTQAPAAVQPDASATATDTQAVTTATPTDPATATDPSATTQPTDTTSAPATDSTDTGHTFAGPITAPQPVYVGNGTYVAPGSSQQTTVTMDGGGNN